jgi:tryptophan synthase alpha chain
MNRYEQVFTRIKNDASIAFIPFASAGDPGLRASEAIFKTYLDAGADVLEIGYPFSDPVADGPINQRAARRAIAAGLTHANFFKLIASLRRYSDKPMGLLVYANSVLHLGYREFCKQASEAGVDSILIADMPPEESGEMLDAMSFFGLQSVFIVSELTPPDRMRLICEATTGFVYVVSRLGSTGVQTSLDMTVKKTLSGLHKVAAGVTTGRSSLLLPLCVGFGISTPEHVTLVKKAGADGAIVGSALVDIIEKNLDHPKRMLSLLAKSVQGFKKAASSR